MTTVTRGSVDPAIELEFPGLGLCWCTVTFAGRDDRASPVRRQLQDLAAHYRGAAIISMRTHPVPQAHRAFFRQIGLDPDVDRPPGEAAAFTRLCQGTFHSSGSMIEDSLLLATIETGVGVWAFDRARIEPPLRIAAGAHGDLTVNDQRKSLAPLFAPPAPDLAPRAGSALLTLYAVLVPGVPEMTVEEALWVAAEAIEPSGSIE